MNLTFVRVRQRPGSVLRRAAVWAAVWPTLCLALAAFVAAPLPASAQTAASTSASAPAPASAATPAVSAPTPAPERVLTPQLDVRAPAGPGWRPSVREDARVGWARAGEGENDSQAAFAAVFRLPAPVDGAGLLEMVRRSVEADTPADRFRALEVDYRREDRGDAPCVRHRAFHEDRQARLRTGGSGVLLLQTVTLYCRHATDAQRAIAIGWSHRGPLPLAGFDEAAQAFIDGAGLR